MLYWPFWMAADAGKWENHVGIFRSQYQKKIAVSSLFAVLTLAQYNTARNTLMYKLLLFCQTYLGSFNHDDFFKNSDNVVTGALLLSDDRPFDRVWLVPLCGRNLAEGNFAHRTSQLLMIWPIKDMLTNVIQEWSRDQTKTVKMQMAAGELRTDQNQADYYYHLD